MRHGKPDLSLVLVFARQTPLHCVAGQASASPRVGALLVPIRQVHACEFCPAAAITSRKNCTASSCDELPTELPSQSRTRRSVGYRRRHSRTPVGRGELAHVSALSCDLLKHRQTHACWRLKPQHNDWMFHCCSRRQMPHLRPDAPLERL